MNKVTGALLLIAAAISGHAVFIFLASHPQINKYDVPSTVAKMVFVAIGVTTALGLWGAYHLLRHDER